MIKIVDCGSQLTQNIARRVRELGAFAEIVPFHTKASEILNNGPNGIIISGGPFSVYDKKAPLYSREILQAGIPVLGICYGQQSIVYLLGGKVIPTENREYGETSVRVRKESPLFAGIPNEEFRVWMSHGDVVEAVPEGFEVIARSRNKHIAAIGKGDVFAVQFHPEVDHTDNGRKILDNFVQICRAPRNWDPEREYDHIVAQTEEAIRGKVGIGGTSGGVDSSSLSVLLKNIAKDSYHPIFVDNGLLRSGEVEQVKESLEPFNLNMLYLDARARFLRKLRSIADPDEKRKIIGHEFIRVFEEAARAIPHTKYLAQGTLYPDVIESVPIYGTSSRIKRHHNVGGLPQKMDLEIVEPFRRLFKDEVRAIAENKLGLPREIVWRHPFPGPGLAVRIVGEVTPEKLSTLRRADEIFIRELKERGIYYKLSQAFAILTNVRSVGVMGDEHTYEGIIALRAITTSDFMTSDWYDFQKEDLTRIANRIINEVNGVNRVVYDVSQKPPSTIEWE
ncbi:glutamine-hydrolyzing GMP synthase [bacterium]|nr:glutamine-hydrolyzing GMP synthase [bacterium]